MKLLIKYILKIFIKIIIIKKEYIKKINNFMAKNLFLENFIF